MVLTRISLRAELCPILVPVMKQAFITSIIIPSSAVRTSILSGHCRHSDNAHNELPTQMAGNPVYATKAPQHGLKEYRWRVEGGQGGGVMGHLRRGRNQWCVGEGGHGSAAVQHARLICFQPLALLGLITLQSWHSSKKIHRACTKYFLLPLTGLMIAPPPS